MFNKLLKHGNNKQDIGNPERDAISPPKVSVKHITAVGTNTIQFRKALSRF
jgi:hypothetical protein